MRLFTTVFATLAFFYFAAAGFVTAQEVPLSQGVTAHLSTKGGPGKAFDLRKWKLTLSVDEDGDSKADEIKEKELARGWSRPGMFYLDPETGGMVFRVDPSNAKTTKNSKYARVELREMMRGGNTSIPTRMKNGYTSKNNWVFGSAPNASRSAAGGVDGKMTAKLSVDQVTQMGARNQVGRVIIGQIHAKDDEPIRLYYRKLPRNQNGSIYFAHEVPGGGEKYIELIGSRKDSARNPVDGIPLGEVFEYSIAVATRTIDGKLHPILYVSITRADGAVIKARPLDMEKTSYSDAEEFMYFKAGAYSQNNTSNAPGRDFDQVTFYDLKVSH